MKQKFLNELSNELTFLTPSPEFDSCKVKIAI